RTVVLKELEPGETRVPVTPQVVERLTRLGVKVEVERGLGASAFISDAEYEAAGAALGERPALIAGADLLLHLNPLPEDVVEGVREGALTAGFLDPFFEPELVGRLAARKVDAIA